MPRQPSLDPALLNTALQGLELQQQRTEAQIAELRRRLGTSRFTGPNAVGEAPRKRTMSAAGRRRIAEAARKRWAAYRKEAAKSSAPAIETTAAPKKRRLSAAGRKRIIEATKRRWAADRTAAAGAQKAAPAKKAAKRSTAKRTRKAAVKAPATAASFVVTAPVEKAAEEPIAATGQTAGTSL